MGFGFGYDIAVSENWAVGIQLSYTSGVLTQIKQSSGSSTETIKLQPEEYEGLTRFDIAIGLRFNH